MEVQNTYRGSDASVATEIGFECIDIHIAQPVLHGKSNTLMLKHLIEECGERFINLGLIDAENLAKLRLQLDEFEETDLVLFPKVAQMYCKY
ncbi:hypothetical protein [Piscirickettsia litoralis]|uniref:Uncharacterized protein n=1 Tax=Piscirickettsia litoralis TaxID=1891921 RepID=A0ABX3A321_9GAMM|nr:hypothetical protein [Piscirickettsia litoralis]ODN42023.1 hypothetical protein BGC07_02430 [Piscirickettsia litoralis]